MQSKNRWQLPSNEQPEYGDTVAVPVQQQTQMQNLNSAYLFVVEHDFVQRLMEITWRGHDGQSINSPLAFVKQLTWNVRVLS